MASLELDLFGGFSARFGAGEPLAPLGRKAQLLLAFLALRAGESQTREKVIGILWSDRGDAQARGSLRQELTVLRKAMGGVDPAAIVIEGERLSLTAAVAVDVRCFEELIQSDATTDLERAVALYKGPFLDGLAVRDSACEEWLLHERERLRLLMLGVLDRLLARQMKAGALTPATATAEAILAHDPLREDMHRTLMQLHAAQGRHSLALKQYRLCKESLARELGVEPEPETDRLHREIQAQRTAPSRPPAPDVAPAIEIEPAGLRERPSIAVLPFANISGDPEQEYFADGLTEDIITDLSRVSALFVVARNTVFTYKGKAVEVREAARALGVDHILEGGVRKAGDRVRITVQLVDGRSGGHLWANRYDRGLDDIFTLQDEISRSIVDALKVKLLPEERALIASRSTTDPDAYQYYLMGRSFFLRSGWGERALRVARQMFVRAAEIDPRYARAYSGIANSDSYLMCMGDPTVSFQDILANSERALALDPALAEAHAAKGLALYTAGRHGEANAVLEHALHLGPDLFEAHFFAARNCRAQGRYRESIPLFERAAELQPDDFRALGLVVNAYRSLGRPDGMLSAARRCFERVEAEVAVHPDNAGALAFGAAALAEIGDVARAEAWAARTAALDPLDSITGYNLACAYVGIGKLDAAMGRLERVFSDPPFRHRSHVEWMKKDSSLAPLRDHPPYHALLARLEAESGSHGRPSD